MDISALRNYYTGHVPTLMGEGGGSAVLVPLVRQNGEYCLLYEIRSAAVHQPGEDAVQCALRETREELSIPESAVTVIGEMDFIHIRAGSLLRPVLGELDPSSLETMRPEAAEVADTFLLPLRVLRQHAPEVYVRQLAVEAPDFPYGDAGVTADYPWRPYRLEVPVFRGLPHPLWGITARITMAVLEKL